MTDSSIIQDARPVLAKWRADTGAWKQEEYGAITSSDGSLIAPSVIEEDARLILGTAGNPELLDAIDEFLAATLDGVAQGFKSYPGYSYAERIAAAIIAAHERMSA